MRSDARRILPAVRFGWVLVALWASGCVERPQAELSTDPSTAIANAGEGSVNGPASADGSAASAESGARPPTPGSGALADPGSGEPALDPNAKPMSGAAQAPRPPIDPAAAERGVLARVALPTITSPYEASRVVAVERVGDGFSVAVADIPGPQAGYQVFGVVPGQSVPSGSAAWLDDGLGHWVGLVGGAFVQIEHVGQSSRVNVDGRTAVLQHADLRHVSVARCGDHLVICGVRSSDEGTSIACGDVTPGREWTDFATRITLPGEQVRTMSLASAPESDGVLVATERVIGTGSRLIGDWLDCATLRPIGEAVDLAGEAWSSGSEIAIPSLWGGSRDGERFWAIGSTGPHFARAGRVGADGTRRMAQVDPPGGVSSRPQLVASGTRWAVVHDEYGRRGERTAVVWGADRPVAAEITLAPDRLPSMGANYARLAAANAGVLAVVVEAATGAEVVLIDPDTLFEPPIAPPVAPPVAAGSGAAASPSAE